jgi:hypothetical protein
MELPGFIAVTTRTAKHPYQQPDEFSPNFLLTLVYKTYSQQPHKAFEVLFTEGF